MKLDSLSWGNLADAEKLLLAFYRRAVDVHDYARANLYAGALGEVQRELDYRGT